MWDPRAPAPIDRVEGVGALVGGKLYVFSGFLNADLEIATRMDLYDPATDTWTAGIGQMPGQGVTHVNPVIDGTDIWIAGGFVGDHPGPATAAVWRFDTVARTWHPGPALPDTRSAGALVRYDRSLHYIGGFAFRDTPENLDNTRTEHWVLDLDNQAAGWQTLASLPEPLGHLSAIVLNKKIYALGGQLRHDRNFVDKSAVYLYDPETDTWAAGATLPTPRSHFEPGTFSFRGRIVIVGGRDNSRPISEIGDVTMYDPESNLWIAMPGLPTTRLAPVATIYGDELIVTHGGQVWNKPTRETWGAFLTDTWENQHPSAPLTPGNVTSAIVGERLITVGDRITQTLSFNLTRGRWESTSRLAPRPLGGGGQAAETFGGRLYLFGGAGSTATKVQVFDPATNQWSMGADAPFSLQHAGIARLGDLLFAASLGGVAAYNPTLDTWEVLPGPPVPVRNVAAGSDGKQFFLFGGRDESNTTTSLIQVYNPATRSWISSADPESGLPDLPRPRRSSGRAVFSEGEFYLIGGTNASTTAIREVDIFDAETCTWRDGAPMVTRRSGVSPAMVADRAYVVGGISANTALASEVLHVYNLDPPQRDTSPPPTDTAGTGTPAPTEATATTVVPTEPTATTVVPTEPTATTVVPTESTTTTATNVTVTTGVITLTPTDPTATVSVTAEPSITATTPTVTSVTVTAAPTTPAPTTPTETPPPDPDLCLTACPPTVTVTTAPTTPTLTTVTPTDTTAVPTGTTPAVTETAATTTSTPGTCPTSTPGPGGCPASNYIIYLPIIRR